ncbi:MAG: AAA family ATPase [Clostridia bacterium]|nr:AAA family ATPase [Clostridia bacterium]
MKKPKEPQKIILLNGPSSSGKSTLSRALQKQLQVSLFVNYSIVSIDDFMKLGTNKKIHEADFFEISGDMCKQVINDLEKYDGVIIDHVIVSERIFDKLNEMLEQYSILLVQVTCPREVLKEREKAREDRCIGSAEASYEHLYPKFGYDVTVDTFYVTPKMGALRIIYDAMM